MRRHDQMAPRDRAYNDTALLERSGASRRGRLSALHNDPEKLHWLFECNRTPSGRNAPPICEGAISRLIDQNGRPSVKLSTSERGGALALVSDAEDAYVRLSGSGLTVTKDGRRQAIP
jgi:hypothetical protein